MRSFVTFGVAVMAMMFWNPGAACSAQDVPSGSYRESCRDIGRDGNTLEARCQDRDGNWHSTKLHDLDRCHGDIVNINGKLICGAESHDHDGDYRDRDGDRDRDRDRDGLPRGTYRDTCRDIRRDGSTLRAKCQKKDGGWRDTSLHNFDRCRDQVINDNGHLNCIR